MDSWYALQVVTGREADVAAMLRRCGIQAIAPAVARSERKDGLWVTVVRCAIPGYAFVRCTMTTPLYYHLTRKPHVLRLLGGAEYTAIPDDQARWIEALSAAAGHATETSTGAVDEAGEVQITGGPLLGLRDRIIRIDARRRRATIAIELYEDTYEVDLGIEVESDKHPGDPAG